MGRCNATKALERHSREENAKHRYVKVGLFDRLRVIHSYPTKTAGFFLFSNDKLAFVDALGPFFKEKNDKQQNDR